MVARSSARLATTLRNQAEASAEAAKLLDLVGSYSQGAISAVQAVTSAIQAVTFVVL